MSAALPASEIILPPREIENEMKKRKKAIR
jgi:hypothetical protein